MPSTRDNQEVPPRPANAVTRIATLQDLDSLQRLINQAFVVERLLKKGGADRLDAEGLEIRRLFASGTFLVMEEAQSLLACVYLKPDAGRCYLGLLSVSPDLRGRGLARKLQLASEEFARDRGCLWMDLDVISPRREELVPLYQKLGYSQQGLADYPADLAARMLQPGHFILMSKAL